jgi:spore coat protein U-like protein
MIISIRKISFAAALVAATGFAADSLAAGSANANMNLSATVSENCTINEVTPGAFPYNGYAANATAPLEANFPITYACTAGATPTITLNEGVTPFASSTPVAPSRQMASGSSRLLYNLFATLANQSTGSVGVAWGTNLAMSPVLEQGVGSEQTVQAYLTIFPGQTVAAGTYSDVVAMTVNF